MSCSQEFLGCHLLDQEVGRQTCVAMSSGESAFHALNLCAARLIFTKNLVDGVVSHWWKDRYPTRTPRLQEALRIAAVEKLKHLQVKSHWLQQASVDGQVKVDRVHRLLNTADLGTKFFDAARRKQLIGMLPLREHERRLERVVDGRSAEDVSQHKRECGSCFEGIRCHTVESTGGVGSWIALSWTIPGVAARAYASDLAG